MMKIALIGNGAWGTALAIHFSREHDTTLLVRTKEEQEHLLHDQENKHFLPDLKFSSSLKITPIDELTKLTASLDLVIIATPTAYLRSTLISNPTLKNIPILLACKGFEKGTGLLSYQVPNEIYPDNKKIGIISGPSFAQELAAGLPCAVCVSSLNAKWISNLAEQLNNNIMRLYINNDPIGVAVGGALKNIIAIATGFVDGMNCGYNARAALITRGLAEISRLGIALGAKEETMRGLGVLGDLILTCTGNMSRNRQVGLELAKGKKINRILQDLGHVAEGINTLKDAISIAQDYQIELPIAEMLNGLVNETISIDKALEIMMQRTIKFE